MTGLRVHTREHHTMAHGTWPGLKSTAAALALCTWPVSDKQRPLITQNFLQGTPYSFSSQILCSHLNILATHWAGPEAEEVTEPMPAM